MKKRPYVLTILFLGFSSLVIASGLLLANTSGKENQKEKNYTCKIPNSKIEFDMIYIPGGEFDMGSPEGEAGREADEGPVHRVRIDPFWMGKTEVTWDEYECYAFKLSEKIESVTRPSPAFEAYDHGFGRGKKPALGISLHAAEAYCEWLSTVTGDKYRIPTEAEWEYACRAGSSTPYSHGDNPKDLEKYGWFDKNSEEQSQKVGQKLPNGWGLHDMLGNAWEFCTDFYEADYYKTFKGNKVTVNPQGPEDGLDPVIRGGSWNDPPSELRSTNRKELPFEWWERDPQRPRGKWWLIDGQYVGFRVVRPVNK
ncbi:formylglycine-generating enzyme family protein [candidate division KSB1 bacterium]